VSPDGTGRWSSEPLGRLLGGEVDRKTFHRIVNKYRIRDD
jgi:hypothetical protein